MKMNNNLLTLYQMINNANITISQFASTVQALMLSVTNSDILTNKVISSVLLQEFLFRIPYDQNLNTFQIRFSGIVNKYAINIVNYCIKLEQLNNFFLWKNLLLDFLCTLGGSNTALGSLTKLRRKHSSHFIHSLYYFVRSYRKRHACHSKINTG